ncbi:glycosyltransferase family 4 protein [Daejeonella lutea]|uniref:Glycosyltransferase involved in cell wall bisynthesis n=1 Tax=Daejeonella lutea TaxID=572036 RepID=A0A1T5FAK3_9SPHI|nr:glycosyltransferase family 4 protein [Daejeonella lutea]SKB93180.1 Glycosyltransferase involved in cell wall bisynthesis [Daejeonella lutea]
MTSRKSFVTIFPEAENFHLVKDVGQIPFFIGKNDEYDAELITYKNNPDYPYLEDEVKGLKLTFIKNAGRYFSHHKAILKFLLSSSKRIDILNLFHFKRENVLYLFLYKKLNPKGKTYVKLDMDILFFKNYNSFFFSHYRLKNLLLKRLARVHFKLTDLFSVETDEAAEYLVNVYPELKDKLICIPNGIDDDYIDRNVTLKTFEQKENIILTVGRIGTEQKNTELFLESLRIADLRDWKVYIIGPVERTFDPYIKSFFEDNPVLKEKIIFTGNITDRTELFEWYNRAKIFCLSSRYEGFPIAFSEALHFGNYIITTPLSSSSFVTDRGRTGSVAGGNRFEFAAAINRTLVPGFLNAERYQQIRSFSKNKLCWPEIVKRILTQLEN